MHRSCKHFYVIAKFYNAIKIYGAYKIAVTLFILSNIDNTFLPNIHILHTYIYIITHLYSGSDKTWHGMQKMEK